MTYANIFSYVIYTSNRVFISEKQRLYKILLSFKKFSETLLNKLMNDRMNLSQNPIGNSEKSLLEFQRMFIQY